LHKGFFYFILDIMQLNNKKIINAWAMYDWANSVYSLVITSAIFPIYYQAVAVNSDGGDIITFFGWEVVNSVLYAWSLSLSFIIVALILPVLSGIADYSGRKKYFMKAFVAIGAFSCMGLYFFTPGRVELAIICSVLASIGYSGSLVFYDAFLPEIATEDKVDKVSAKGYALGYIGSVILMIINIIMIREHIFFGFADEGAALRFAFLTVGIWWLGFSFIPFKLLPGNIYNRKPKEGRYLTEGYREIRKVWHSLKSLRIMKMFLWAFFFYNMGVQTVMYLSATFGAKELKLEGDQLILIILIIQVVAISGAYFFAHISRLRGNKKSLMLMIFIWILICIAAYFMTNATHFFLIAVVVGLVMGGIQSLSRATFAKLIPKDTTDHVSFFSFYDITYNISIVIGTFSYGFIESLTGNMRNSTLALVLFFVIGLGFLMMSKIPFHKIEAAN
jgi:UMF1 family MFS transporter